MGVPHPRGRGGPATHLPLLVAYFRRHPDFSIRTFYYGSRKYGLTEESVYMKLLVVSFTYLNFLYHLLTFRPDVVHLNTAFGGSYSLLRDFPFAATSWLLRLKLFFKMHGSLDEVIRSKSMVIRALSKVFFKGASIVGVLTESERREFHSHYQVGNKIRIVKNIVPPALVNRDARYVFPTDSIYGLFVSRIDSRKGLSDLIKAVPGIIMEAPTFRLIVAGDGPNMWECRMLAERNGSNRYIHWLGWVDTASLSEVFSVAKVFIFPTNYPEGMPMSLIGAMGAGLPIVTTRCRFVNDFLVEGRNYLPINRNDPSDIQEKVIRLLNDHELQNRMKVENRKFAARYSVEAVGNEFVRLYYELINDASACN